MNEPINLEYLIKYHARGQIVGCLILYTWFLFLALIGAKMAGVL